jgi:HD domain-containing protein
MVGIDGVTVPGSKLAREAAELVRNTASSLLFNHSCRVYYFGALAGQRNGLSFDPELLYIGAMFHDMGLTARYSSTTDRFEVDGANAARDFLRSHGFDQREIDLVWAAVALHTTPGIPKYMHPVIALINAGVLMDAVGIGYEQFTEAQRTSVTALYPRGADFEEEFIQAFYDWNKHKPETTYGTVTADVLVEKDPNFHRPDMCARIRHSRWTTQGAA